MGDQKDCNVKDYWVDIPHALESQLCEYAKKWEVDHSEGEDGVSRTYLYNGHTSFVYPNTLLDRITVCNKPLKFNLFGHSFSPNSGAHRIVLEGTFEGEKYVVAVEEIESRLTCNYDGDAIWVGAKTFAGLIKVLENKERFASHILTQWIYLATGLFPSIPSGVGDPAITPKMSPTRFKVFITDPEQLRNNLCQHSDLATQCFLFAFSSEE